jgi:predicted phosphodiesterase
VLENGNILNVKMFDDYNYIFRKIAAVMGNNESQYDALRPNIVAYIPSTDLIATES